MRSHNDLPKCLMSAYLSRPVLCSTYFIFITTCFRGLKHFTYSIYKNLSLNTTQRFFLKIIKADVHRCPTRCGTGNYKMFSLFLGVPHQFSPGVLTPAIFPTPRYLHLCETLDSSIFVILLSYCQWHRKLILTITAWKVSK